MTHNRHGKRDNDIIWEALSNRYNIKHSKQLSKLWEQDVKYVEQFLIDEGLMDTVKKGFGSVKNFASDKLLKPVMDFLAGIIAKDPQMSQKAQAAAAQGPEALQQLASTEGDQSVIQQLDQPITQGESYAYQFKLNQTICEALVTVGILTESASKSIQQCRYDIVFESILTLQKTDCPWKPSGVVTESAREIARQITQLMKQGGNSKKVLNALLATDESGFKEYLFNNLKVPEATLDRRVQQIKRSQQTAPTEPVAPTETEPVAPTETEPLGTTEPTETGSVPPTNSGASDTQAIPPALPDASAGQKTPGLLGKVWNFIKNNKGAIGGAAAMGLAAAIATSTGNPMAFSYLVGGLVGGAKGAIQGATQTQGGFTDKLKGAANAAGTGSMKAGGLAAAASGIGSAASNAVNGAEVPGSVDPVTPSTPGEPVDPGSDYGGNPGDYSTGGQFDQETPNIGGSTGGFNPETGQSNMDLSDDEVAAYNAQSQADANGEIPGVDYQEPTATSPEEAEAAAAGDTKSFSQKFKDFFKPASPERAEELRRMRQPVSRR